MVFSTTPIYALGIAAIWLILWFRVTSLRSSMDQSIGDGGDQVLLQRIRQHGNCADWAGFILILMILAEGTKAMREARCWFLFLPPYSPDLNPIEMAFSKLKAHLRRIGARTFTDMFKALSEICDLYSQDECWNYFEAAGYVSG